MLSVSLLISFTLWSDITSIKYTYYITYYDGADTYVYVDQSDTKHIFWDDLKSSLRKNNNNNKSAFFDDLFWLLNFVYNFNTNCVYFTYRRRFLLFFIASFYEIFATNAFLVLLINIFILLLISLPPFFKEFSYFINRLLVDTLKIKN